MKELTAKDIKKIMYGEEIKPTKLEKADDTKLTVSRDMVLIESNGQKQSVPSMIAFTKLLRNYEILRSNYNKAAKELNVLRESVKILITTVNQMDDELKKKIDRPE